MADAPKIAGQSAERLADALDRAIAKSALKGDRVQLMQLRRACHAVMTGATDPWRPDAVFRGKKQRAFEGLLAGMTTAEAAAHADCHPGSIARWKREDEFIEALKEGRERRAADAAAMMHDLLPLAVRRMRAILLDPHAQHKDLLAAFREVADRAGLPKTERVEHAGSVRVDDGRNASAIDAEIEAARAELAALEAGEE